MNDTPSDRVAHSRKPAATRPSPTQMAPGQNDLFHNEVPTEYIADVFTVMLLARQHTFMVLTKRHGRMRSLLSSPAFQEEVRFRHQVLVEDYPGSEFHWPITNLWMGVTAEDQQRALLRIPALFETPAAVRMVSVQPALGPMDFTDFLVRTRPVTHDRWDAPDGADMFGMRRHGDRWDRHTGIDWVIVGGESGRGARPMAPTWARRLQQQCQDAEVPFLFKQWGEWTGQLSHPAAVRDPDAYVNVDTGDVADEATATAAGGDWTGMFRLGKARTGRLLDGRTWDEFPAPARPSHASDTLAQQGE